MGAGTIAHTVGADIAASESSEVRAVAARDLDRAGALATELDAPAAYASYAQLADDPDVDVVYIATTHAQHHDQALLALRADKPVLVEKAFTLNARQATDVVQAARERDLFAMEAMWMRFNPLLRRAQDLIADGAIGDVVSVRADLSAAFPYDPSHRLYDLSVGGGALLDLGVYPVNFAWVFLGRPEDVQAAGQLSPTGSDMTTAQQWWYADGRFAQVACTTLAPNPQPGLVSGTEGWLSLTPRLHRPQELTVHTEDGDQTILAAEIGGSEGNGYRPQVAEVERCLRAGVTESPVVPLDTTVAIMQLLDQVRAQVGVRYDVDDESE